MYYAVAKEHRDFFRRHSLIEFDDLLSEEQVKKFSQEITAFFSKRFKPSLSKTWLGSSENGFSAGRDLWRNSKGLKKLILQKNLAEIASELIELKPLRIGYDQLMIAPTTFSLLSEVHREWLIKKSSLQQKSCLQGVLCGLMLCIAAPETSVTTANSSSNHLNLFSNKAGNGVFFAPDLSVDFADLQHRPGYAYLLIVYTKNISVYIKQEDDPYTHDFRNLGYHFGDRLLDRYHPLV